MYDNILDTIGNTPIVKLPRLGRHLRDVTIAVKLETTNPGGSSKDRPALAMIEAAEAAGLLLPGGTIVEPTSGNTGIGLAIVAAQRGYHCIFVMTDKVAPEKVALLRAYGAEVVVCPVAVAPEDPTSYYSVAERLTRETPGAYRPNQYANAANPAAHEATTGPEIWAQTDGTITHFVAGCGTGGTISGAGRYLKAQNPGIQIVGADPQGSVYSGGDGRPYLVEGIGEDFWPATYDPSVIDTVIPISDADSFAMARRVTKEEGILIGGSGGTAVAAMLHVAERAPAGSLLVALIPDSGRGYLSRVFDDQWMAGHGFTHAADGPTVGDAIETKPARGTSGNTPSLVWANPEQTVRDTVDAMRHDAVSQVPVIKNQPPFAAAEVVGAVTELELMDVTYRNPSMLDAPVGEVMGPRLPTVGIGQSLSDAVAALDKGPAVLVLADGRPYTVLTRTDILTYLRRGQQ